MSDALPIDLITPCARWHALPVQDDHGMTVRGPRHAAALAALQYFVMTMRGQQ
ncbi:hypothetical protein [Rhizobium halophytocola]|uniref:Uncharacterized protein n=1 Tax=Rhizobium halophytocola TaxID=735519 RepID=A0ABS4E0S9_9HYPH|nr:hypothetical protein [Rhizobium halophytocola]MBP1851545.1 hypothetical protein [Rhizobium halophytocola]